MSEDKYLTHFQIIATAGEAKSIYMQAFSALEEYDFESAQQLANKASELFVMAHDIELKMLQDEANGNSIETNIIAVHAQDYLTTVTIFKDLFDKELRLYKRIKALEDKVYGKD